MVPSLNEPSHSQAGFGDPLQFLWSNEKAEGAVEGSKDRPCVIVVAVKRTADGEIETIVAPITHRPPEDTTASIEIPAATCKSPGLDDERHWLRLDELSRFSWPGFDLRPIPGRPDKYEYGMLPPGLFQRLREGILTRQRERAGRTTYRNEE